MSRPLEGDFDTQAGELVKGKTHEQAGSRQNTQAFQSAATLQALPADLKERVLDYLSDSLSPRQMPQFPYQFGLESEGHRDCRRLAQSCRTWRQLIRPKLYHAFSLVHLRKKSLAQLAALGMDFETLELVRVLVVNVCCRPRTSAPRDEAHFTDEIVRTSAHREEIRLYHIITETENAVGIRCETELSERVQAPFYLLPSIYSHPSLTTIESAGPASTPLVAALTQIIRFSRCIMSVALTGRTWDGDAYADKSARESARVELMQAAALATKLVTLRFSDIYICAATPSASRLGWHGHLKDLHIGFGELAPGTAAPLIQSLVRSQHDSLEKLVIGRRYLNTVSPIISESRTDRKLRKLRVVASNRHTPFETHDLEDLSTIALKKLSLYGEGAAALAYAVLQTKACASLTTLKLDGWAQDKARLRAIRDFVHERTGLVATWGKTRLEDLDLA